MDEKRIEALKKVLFNEIKRQRDELYGGELRVYNVTELKEVTISGDINLEDLAIAILKANV